jgi:3-oxoacyl-[acyl-carrier protein] reductase
VSAGDANGTPLDGRTAIVTGAGSGIGRAVAQALAAAGSHVVCADIDAEAAEATAAGITEFAGSASATALDVTDRGQVHGLVREVRDRVERLDIMCNIAGIATTSRIVDTQEDELDRVLAVNVKGVYFGCQAAAQVMIDQGSGCIVNMASSSVDTPAESLGCYALSKAAVAQITRTLALEVGRYGVRVNAVAPGFVATPLTLGERSVSDPAIARRIAKLADATALGRVNEAYEVADAVLFLASDSSSGITGHTLRVNAGSSMA